MNFEEEVESWDVGIGDLEEASILKEDEEILVVHIGMVIREKTVGTWQHRIAVCWPQQDNHPC